MSRETFQNLLEKYESGLCTPAEKQIVEKWYGLLDSEDCVLEPGELSSLEQKLWDKINLRNSEEDSILSVSNGKGYWNFKKVLGIAAMISFAMILLILNRNAVKDRNAVFLSKNAPILKTFYNGGHSPKSITLEDGSKVTLEPMARLTFPEHFKDSLREVSLDGNGFFLISKNPKRPFLVYNKQIVTRVLGTSFSIRLNPGTNETEVTVKTGKVRVTPNRETGAIMVPELFVKPTAVTLIPNEKAIYNVSKKGFSTTLADNPVPVVKIHKSSPTSSSPFSDALVKDVVASLMDTYGIHIILKSDDLKAITFTGDLSSLNLYSKLDFLCQSIDAQYHIEGTQIIIVKNH
ncbi:MAG: hypothetical protein JWQ28_216 [Pedobacter sp.]|jgi:transmembrane sensor|nr:hypothetical protein [Pedobacter sp.]